MQVILSRPIGTELRPCRNRRGAFAGVGVGTAQLACLYPWTLQCCCGGGLQATPRCNHLLCLPAVLLLCLDPTLSVWTYGACRHDIFSSVLFW